MKIVRNKLLPPKGFSAINLFGITFTRHGVELTARIIRHETIHTQQMIEMLYIPFYLAYVIEWLVRLLQYRDAHEAYMNISFEREAYANDNIKNYVIKRQMYSWTKYLTKRKGSN